MLGKLNLSSTNIIQRIYQAWSLLRLSPFDLSTVEGRSKERYRRIALTSVAGVSAKGIGIITSLISVPLTVDYLGTERYGLWMTISSVIALLGFADLGMGNGLLNAVAEADGKDDRAAALTYVSSAFFMLSGIGLSLLMVFALTYSFIPWHRVFNVTSAVAVRESGPAMAVLTAIFAFNMPFGIVQRVQMGYQEGFKNYLWGIVGALLGLAGLLVAVYLKAGLPWLILAMSGGPTLALLLNWLTVFVWSKPGLFPRWRAFNRAAGGKILSTGTLFLILQVLALVGTSSDNVVIAQMLGASAVASYAVTQKLFSITQIAQFFTQPLWPAFGEAMARADYAWARSTLNRFLLLSLGLGLATALPLLVLGKPVIALWAGPALVPSTLLLAGFSLWVLLAGYGGSMSSFLNSGSLLGRQTTFFAIASIISLLLKVILAHTWQTAGVIWGTVIGYGIFYVVPAGRLAYGALRDPVKPEGSPEVEGMISLCNDSASERRR